MLLILGLGVGAWTLFTSVTEDVLLTPAATLLLLVTASIAVIGAAARTELRASAIWAALSLVGFGVTLALVDQGGAVVYQHLRPAIAPWTRDDILLLAAAAAQAVLACIGLRAHGPTIHRWLAREIGVLRGAFLILGVVALGASPLRDLRGYGFELVLSTGLTLVALTTVLLSLLELPASPPAALDDFVRRALRGVGDRGWDVVALTSAAFTTVLCATLAKVVYEAHPHVSDEFGFLFQALYFAQGKLSAPGVPVPEAFESYQIECSLQQCVSVLQPGWPSVLAVGAALGVPWLVNPVIAGANVLLAFVLVRELYDVRVARLVAVLLASSPWFVFLGMSLMNHQATLTFALAGVLGAVLALRRGQPAWALLGGAGVGLTSWMRPMDGVVAAVVAGLTVAATPGWSRRLREVSLFALGVGVFGSLNLVYNQALTGDSLAFPVTSYVNELWGEGANDLGFGADRGVYPDWAQIDPFPGHSPFQAVVNAVLNLTALQVDLFGWAIGSLTPLLLFLSWGRLTRVDIRMIATVSGVVGLYSLYFFSGGPDFAARYWFVTVIPLTALSARALLGIAARFGSHRAYPVAVGGALLVLHSLTVFVPWRSADKYHEYIGTRPDVREALETGLWPADVFLVRGASHPDFAGAMIYSAPDLAGPGPVIAYDAGDHITERLMDAFPGRRIWKVDGPGETGGGYRIVGRLR